MGGLILFVSCVIRAGLGLACETPSRFVISHASVERDAGLTPAPQRPLARESAVESHWVEPAGVKMIGTAGVGQRGALLA